MSGQRSVNGGVSVFLCQTEASPDPTGLAPRCPQRGKVTGMVQSVNMIEGPIVNQGVEPGQFNELIAAIRAGVAYVNVHSSTFPGGEVRGQLRLNELTLKSYNAGAGLVLFSGSRETRGKDMNMIKILAVLAFGSVLLAGCGADKDESAAQTDAASPAVETTAPPSEDTMSPADTTDTMPSDEADPAMSDTLPTDQQPPPTEPAPPPNG